MFGLGFSARFRTWAPPSGFPKLDRVPETAHTGSSTLVPSEYCPAVYNHCRGPSMGCLESSSRDHTTKNGVSPKVLVSVSHRPGQNQSTPSPEVPREGTQMYILHQACSPTLKSHTETGLVGSRELWLSSCAGGNALPFCLTLSFHQLTLHTRNLAL